MGPSEEQAQGMGALPSPPPNPREEMYAPSHRLRRNVPRLA